MRRAIAIAAVLCAIALGARAQETQDKPAIVHNANAKFGPLPGIPDCMTAAPQHGDPAKGPFVLLLKFESACVIPWHWHSINETLISVNGLLQITHKGERPQVIAGGDYAYMPARQVHQAKCADSHKPCTVFLSSDGPFDLHYVDKAGNEIPPEQALADVNKPPDKPGAKPAPKQ